MKNKKVFKSIVDIKNLEIGEGKRTLFIAEIASNFDGDLNRAKDLIFAAKEAGADVAKFQHYSAETLVSDYGFKNLKINNSHQNSWKKSVFETYKKASLNPEWTLELYETCKKAKIIFMTSPYSIELADYVERFVPAFKIGSGDITWHEEIEHIAKKKKPIFLATGASSLVEVIAAVNIISKHNTKLVLMQCNTNYTNSFQNLNYLNLKTLTTFKSIFPGIITGLSDHTQNDQAVLASVALGAKVIERHFTDSVSRRGPDHSFSTDVVSWKKMVSKVRELEKMLGDGTKKVENNEKQTIIVQRRALYAKINIKKGQKIMRKHLIPLRPHLPIKSIPANAIKDIIGKTAKKMILAGEFLTKNHLSK
jgi:N-acetylneuraminate synthase